MNRRNVPVAIAAAFLIGVAAVLTLTSPETNAGQRAFAADSVYRLSGNFEVQFSTVFAREGHPTPPGKNGSTLVDDVRHIDLLPDWAVLVKKEAAREITFMVPREQVIFINATD